MRKLMLIFNLILPFMALSQRNTAISIHAGMDLTNRNFQQANGVKSSPKFNYRVGLGYDKSLSEKCWLEAGLQLSSIGYNGAHQTGLRWGSEFQANGTWVPDPTLPHEIRFIYDYLMLEIPVGIRYVFGNKRWKPYVGAGLSLNLVFHEQQKQITDIGGDISTHDSSGFLNITISSNLGFGVDYAVSDNYRFFVQSAFRGHFTKLKSTPVPLPLYNMGLELGIRKSME